MFPQLNYILEESHEKYNLIIIKRVIDKIIGYLFTRLDLRNKRLK